LSCLSYWGLKGLKGRKGKKRDECFVILWNERSNKSSVRLSCLSSKQVRLSRLSSFIVLRSLQLHEPQALNLERPKGI